MSHVTDTALWMIISGSALATSVVAFATAATAKSDTQWVRRQLEAAKLRQASTHPAKGNIEP